MAGRPPEVVLLAPQFFVIAAGDFVVAFVAKTHITLSTVTRPVIIVIPGALKFMRKKEILIIRAGFDCEILCPAGASVGQLFVFFGAGNTIDCRKGGDRNGS